MWLNPVTKWAVDRADGSSGGRVSVQHRHGALAIGQVHHDEAIGVRLRGDTGLATQQVEGSPGGDRLLQATQAAAAVGEDEVVEGVRLKVRDELLGGAAVHVQCESVVLDLQAGVSQHLTLAQYLSLTLTPG